MKGPSLSDLLTDVTPRRIDGPAAVAITGITADSRTVVPGMVFVAISGFTVDGHDFVPEALARGARAAVVQKPVAGAAQITVVTVPDTRVALAQMSAAFYGHPSEELQLIGVTGTNGKGTTAALIQAMLAHAGIKTGLIGTLGAKIGEREIDLGRTTPEAPQLQALLREMVDAGMSHAVMEVASHGLALHRVDGCRFRAAVFTNLTQDHLDFHGSMEEYRRAKQRLFEMVDADGAAIVNADDAAAGSMIQATRARVTTYGIARAADIRAEDVRLATDGTSFTVRATSGLALVRSRLRGKFNVSNALAAVATATTQGVDLEVAAAALADFPGVPGRFEAVDEGQPFAVIVDYAHTPDSLTNVLRTAREFARGRVIVVFGAGGDRDRTKRPIMGRIAEEIADVAIVTSDNPRSEEPAAIIEEIMDGVRGSGFGARAQVDPDRRKAIHTAIGLAGPGDVVVIAGKGHEPYQEIQGVKHSFDDRTVAREAILALGFRTPNPEPPTSVV
ncbi:MAG: UDP-N-acetylmuramoyl-L-alanyl-D-glutamate--2,6-diaminopimelate ligase [bacterium]